MRLTISNDVVDFVLPAGGRKFVLAAITFDAAYPAGGEAVTAAEFGLSAIERIIPCGSNAAANDHLINFDKENSKILVFDMADGVDAGTQATGDNLSTFIFYVLVIGY